MYVEFNTSYRLTVEDTKGMPPSEKKVCEEVLSYSVLKAALPQLNVCHFLVISPNNLAKPRTYDQAASMVDEVCSCWALVNFRKCCGLSSEITVSVPLYYGSLYEPLVSESALGKAVRLSV